MPRGWWNPRGPMNVKGTTNRVVVAAVVVDVAVHPKDVPTWDKCLMKKLILDVDVYI